MTGLLQRPIIIARPTRPSYLLASSPFDLMDSRPKPIVGQTIYAKPINNAARYGNVELRPVIVATIGRKWFTIRDSERYHVWRERFNVGDWTQDRKSHSP